MKRILVFSLLLATLSVTVFADTSYSGSSVPPGDGKDPTVVVQYVIDSNTGSYSIGFADSVENATSGTGIGSDPIKLVIDSTDNTIISNEGKDLYIFWDITSAAKYALSLETSALVNSAAQEKNTIGIEVTGESVGENPSETLANIDAPSSAAVSSSIIPTTTEGAIGIKKGMQKLTIKSKAGELNEKVVGTYSANLTLKLAAI